MGLRISSGAVLTVPKRGAWTHIYQIYQTLIILCYQTSKSLNDSHLRRLHFGHPPVTRPRNLSLLPAGGPGLGPPGAAALTCRHEEDAGTQDDVVSSLIELAGCDAESTHEEQNHTQDREDARGPHSPWRTQWVGRENAMAVR